jgi:hypothetical protein
MAVQAKRQADRKSEVNRAEPRSDTPSCWRGWRSEHARSLGSESLGWCGATQLTWLRRPVAVLPGPFFPHVSPWIPASTAACPPFQKESPSLK